MPAAFTTKETTTEQQTGANIQKLHFSLDKIFPISFPEFSPTLPYGARGRRVGERTWERGLFFFQINLLILSAKCS